MPDLDSTALRATLERAADAGFYGFSGRCGQAAVAINRVLLDGQGTLVGAFNAAFYAKGRLIGHVAVLVGDRYWDSDARPKSADEILSWGMLDPDDPDYVALAEHFGLTWDEDVAEDVTFVTLSEAEALAAWGAGSLDVLEAQLAAALTTEA